MLMSKMVVASGNPLSLVVTGGGRRDDIDNDDDDNSSSLNQTIPLMLSSGSGGGGDNGSCSSQSSSNMKRKKARTTFTGRQIFELEKQFEVKKYLSSSERSEMARLLNVTETQVCEIFLILSF